MQQRSTVYVSPADIHHFYAWFFFFFFIFFFDSMASSKHFFIALLFKTFCSVASSATPALFIFGDSLVDAGNNNNLNTTAKANHLPYGADFDGHIATGRFSDGRLVCDYIANLLGLGFAPPYLGASRIAQHGANFGSAGSGIQEETGFGQHLSFADQVSAFQEYKQKLGTQIGNAASSSIISKAIFYITEGNNDVNNYLHQHPGVSTLPNAFQDQLIRSFQEQITRLYHFGARKFVITSLSSVGCIPENQIRKRCARDKQGVSRIYNAQLRQTIANLRTSFSGVKIVYANLFKLMQDVVKDPGTFGFQDAWHPCCPAFESSNYTGSDTPDLAFVAKGWCNEGDKYCSNPSEYVYWDVVHTTDAFNRLFVGWQSTLH